MNRKKDVHLAGKVLKRSRHVCAFNSNDEECRVPIVIIGGILQENPFFVPPAEMLRELRERRGA